MSYSVEKKDKYAVIIIQSEKLDGTVSPSMKSELVMLNSEGFKNIIIDLSGTRYCDSSGLSAILVGNRLCKNSEGTFIIAEPQPSVNKLIAISQLDSILNITPTMKEAVDLLFLEEIERDVEGN